MRVVTGCKPSAMAVNLISPAWPVDWTIICARPLKTLRDHTGASGWVISQLACSKLPPLDP